MDEYISLAMNRGRFQVHGRLVGRQSIGGMEPLLTSDVGLPDPDPPALQSIEVKFSWWQPKRSTPRAKRLHIFSIRLSLVS